MFRVKHFLLLFLFTFTQNRYIISISRVKTRQNAFGGFVLGKIISIVNQKGGVGKTTTAVNLVAAMGDKRKKILLIDADPQGNSTSGYGINKRDLSVSSYDLLIGNTTADKAIVKTEFKNVDIIPCNIQLAGAEVEMIELENRESMLKKAVACVRDSYDYIFIDCPPSLGLITINALCASDTFLVPVQCEYFALEGLSQLMATVRQVKRMYNPMIDLEGVLLTMYDGRLNLTQQVVSEIKKFFANKLFKTVIPRSVRLSEAPSYGLPIMYYDKRNKGTSAYESLAKEIIKNNKR